MRPVQSPYKETVRVMCYARLVVFLWVQKRETYQNSIFLTVFLKLHPQTIIVLLSVVIFKADFHCSDIIADS